MKGGVPAFAPKFSGRAREQGSAHQRRRMNSSRTPRERKQMEQSEMQEKDQADHPGPSREQRVDCERVSCRDPEQSRTDQNFERRKNELCGSRFFRRVCFGK